MAAKEAERICQWLVDTHGIIADGLLAEITDSILRYEATIQAQGEIIDRASEVIGGVRLQLVRTERLIQARDRAMESLKAEIEALKKVER